MELLWVPASSPDFVDKPERHTKADRHGTVLFNIVVLTILVPLFYLEIYGHIPLVKALMAEVSSRLEQQLAYVYILLNLIGAIFLSLMIGPYSRVPLKQGGTK